jgi:hypothetical protein
MNPITPFPTRGHRLTVSHLPVSRRSGFLVLLGAALSFSPFFQMRATAQDVGSPQATTSVGFGHGESPGEEHQDTGTYFAVTTFTDPDTQDLHFGSGTATVSATPLVIGGTAEMPDLHALAAPDAEGNEEGVGASASFSDTLEFSNPDALLPTVFNFSFLVTGSLSGNSSATLSASWGSIDPGNFALFTTTSVAQLFTLSIPSSSLGLVVNGDNDKIGGLFGITLTASANNTEPNSTTLESSTADFSQTVQLVSAAALDANGNPVAGTFTDGDQILFPANTVFVSTPEPATFLLLAPVLGLLVAFGRKLPRYTQGA